MSEIITKKKRGRKPKNYNNLLQKNENVIIEEKLNSEEEKVVFHLPITMEDINNHTNALSDDISLFIKSDNEIKNIKTKTSDDSDYTETLKSTFAITQNDNQNINNSINKIITHNINFTKKTKCWWCKNPFNTPPVQLPEDYYNETFYCFGNFCSFNCMKSYNLDLNDSLLWKRESLINLLYFLTYSEYKNITAAPHWITLEEYGGSLSIEEFRQNSLANTKEYLILHPPLISRQMQIEESYKLNKLKEVPIDKINKMYSEIDSEYIIKRKNPIQSSQLNLETTMGLKVKKKIFKL
jgi:hypothetical protein